MPEATSRSSNTVPIGSGNPATSSRPCAMSRRRLSFSVSRSTLAEPIPLACAAATSRALASRMRLAWSSIPRAMALVARVFCPGVAEPSPPAGPRASGVDFEAAHLLERVRDPTLAMVHPIPGRLEDGPLMLSPQDRRQRGVPPVCQDNRAADAGHDPGSAQLRGHPAEADAGVGD